MGASMQVNGGGSGASTKIRAEEGEPAAWSAPLVVEDPGEPLAYDDEWVVVLDDWLDGVGGRTPEREYADLRGGMGGGHMMGVGSSGLLGGDAGDVRYPHFGMGERYDALVTLADGVFPLVALAEGKNGVALGLVRTGPGAAPAGSVRPAELAGKGADGRGGLRGRQPGPVDGALPQRLSRRERHDDAARLPQLVR